MDSRQLRYYEPDEHRLLRILYSNLAQITQDAKFSG
jgi:hypothetical protein